MRNVDEVYFRTYIKNHSLMQQIYTFSRSLVSVVLTNHLQNIFFIENCPVKYIIVYRIEISFIYSILTYLLYGAESFLSS